MIDRLRKIVGIRIGVFNDPIRLGGIMLQQPSVDG